jgi:hypothetical protein
VKGSEQDRFVSLTIHPDKSLMPGAGPGDLFAVYPTCIVDT